MTSFLFIHQNFPGQFRHLAPALVEAGHSVTALGMSANAESLPGVRYFQHKLSSSVGMTQQAPQLRDVFAKILRGESAAASLQQLKDSGCHPDVIYVHPGWGEGLFVRDVFPQAKIIVYAEYYYGAGGGDSFFDPEFSAPPTLVALQKLRMRNTHLLHAMSAADIGISPTQFQCQRHPDWFQQRIQVVHDGIDSRRFTPDSAARLSLARDGIVLRAGDEIVTFVARQLEPYRGYHTFMRALPTLQRLRPNVRVVIVGADGTSYGAAPPKGDSWKAIFRREVADRLDMQRVHFVGKLPHTLLTTLMQVSAVYTYLTYPFVLSWSLMEAMSAGCLIVASNTAPVEEVITHEQNGLLADFFDAEALAHTIANALEKRDHLTHLREAARQTIIDRFDLRNHCLPEQIRIATS